MAAELLSQCVVFAVAEAPEPFGREAQAVRRGTEGPQREPPVLLVQFGRAPVAAFCGVGTSAGCGFRLI